MLRRLLAVIPLALLTACIIPPGDREQIEALIRSRESALARDDVDTLYRMHDLDYRMICSPAQFRQIPRDPAPAGAVRSIEIRAARAWATLAEDAGAEEQLAFVKDSGRWYLYEDAAPCLRSAAVRDG
jgi:hypothetical protein